MTSGQRSVLPAQEQQHRSWPSWTDWPPTPSSAPPPSASTPPSLLRSPFPLLPTTSMTTMTTTEDSSLLFTRAYHPDDFHGFETETDPKQPTTPPPASAPASAPLLSPRLRRRQARHHFLRQAIRTLLMTGASLLVGVVLTTIFVVVHVLPLLPPFSASSPLGAWVPLMPKPTATVPTTLLTLTPAPTPSPMSLPPVVVSQTKGDIQQQPSLGGGEDACIIGSSHVEDTTGKGELDIQMVQHALVDSHLQMFLRVESVAQTSVAITNEGQFGHVEQAIYGSQDLGTPPPGGILSPTAHEFCSLYLIADTTHDWVAIGGKAGVAPFTPEEYQAARVLYHQVEAATSGRHTPAVLAVLAYFHSLLLASSASSSPSSSSSP